jgi:hypothetical protein
MRAHASAADSHSLASADAATSECSDLRHELVSSSSSAMSYWSFGFPVHAELNMAVATSHSLMNVGRDPAYGAA